MDLREQFQIAAASLVGREHLRRNRNNQDGVAVEVRADRCVAVVTDGCGEASRSEVGATLGARFLASWLVRAELCDGAGCAKAACEALIEFLGAVAKACSPAREEAFVAEHLLFTVLAAVVTPERYVVFGSGDGVVRIDEKTRVLDSGPENAPAYLGYRLVGREVTPEVLAEGATGSLRRIAIGTDGCAPLISPDDALGTLADEVRAAQNATLLQRGLVVLRDRERRVQDDATVVVLQRHRREELRTGSDAGKQGTCEAALDARPSSLPSEKCTQWTPRAPTLRRVDDVGPCEFEAERAGTRCGFIPRTEGYAPGRNVPSTPQVADRVAPGGLVTSGSGFAPTNESCSPGRNVPSTPQGATRATPCGLVTSSNGFARTGESSSTGRNVPSTLQVADRVAPGGLVTSCAGFVSTGESCSPGRNVPSNAQGAECAVPSDGVTPGGGFASGESSSPGRNVPSTSRGTDHGVPGDHAKRGDGFAPRESSAPGRNVPSAGRAIDHAAFAAEQEDC